ncbi:MAG: hypothetical protein JO362_14250 [Streptomycetaceae bacterium]|nr:hypothetical protein [Streptomycetaceae bacterium]
MTRFVRELTPAGTVRAAAPDGAGGWSNAYPPPVISLPEADPARPVAVHLYARRRGVRRCVLPLADFDAKKASAEQARAEAAEYAAALEAEGIAPVPADSGGGGVHVWSGCAEGFTERTARRIAEAAARLWSTYDKAPMTNPRVGAGRPPGAPHRNGGHSRLTRHSIDEVIELLGAKSAPAAAYERLAVRLETMAAARGAQADSVDHHQHEDQDAAEGVPPSILERGPTVRQLAADAHGNLKVAVAWRPLGDAALKGLSRTLGRRVDHDVQVHAVLRSMALAGWTLDEAAAVVRDAASSPALEWLRSKRVSPDGPRQARDAEETARLLARKWFLACQDAARMPRRPDDDPARVPPGEVAAAVLDLMARMQAAGPARWGRESGPADAALLMALAWLMLLSGSTDVSADVRRLGVLAGYSHQTASAGLYRLIRDGWIKVTADADRRAGKARRVTLATAHECTDHHRHTCAVYDVPAAHTGSDRSVNAAPPAPLSLPPAELPAYLRTVVVRQQSDVWHRLGHHASRTLRAVTEAQRPTTIPYLMTATGYTRATITKHLQAMEALKLISSSRTRSGQLKVRAGRGTLYAAAQAVGTAGRIAARAVAARIDQAVHAWQRAEEEWCALSREEKRQRGPRRGPDQMVLPGMSPTARAYPRHPHPRTGTPQAGPMDHARAQQIEAGRIGAAALLTDALRLAASGQVIDPPRLSAERPTEHTPAKPTRPRVVLPARHACPLCGAEPGERCHTRRGRRAADWHAARRQAAGAAPTTARTTRPSRRPAQPQTPTAGTLRRHRGTPATTEQLPLFDKDTRQRHTRG